MTYVDYLVQFVPWKQASGPWLRVSSGRKSWLRRLCSEGLGEREAKADQRPDSNEWKPAIWPRVELRGFVFNA